MSGVRCQVSGVGCRVSGLGVDYFGHADLAEGFVGGVAEEVGLIEAGAGGIFAESVEYGRGMGSGFDAIDIDAFEGFDIPEDRVELPLKGAAFLIAEIDPCQVRDMTDIHVLTAHAGEPAWVWRNDQAYLGHPFMSCYYT